LWIVPRVRPTLASLCFLDISLFGLPPVCHTSATISVGDNQGDGLSRPTLNIDTTCQPSSRIAPNYRMIYNVWICTFCHRHFYQQLYAFFGDSGLVYRLISVSARSYPLAFFEPSTMSLHRFLFSPSPAHSGIWPILLRTIALVDITTRCSPLANTGCLVSCGWLRTNLCNWFRLGLVLETCL